MKHTTKLTLLLSLWTSSQAGHKPQKAHVRMARAISKGNLNRVTALIKQNPEIINRPHSGLTPLLRATFVAQTEINPEHPRIKIIAQLTKNNANPATPGPQFLDTPLMYACSNPVALDALLSNLPNPTIIPELLARKDARGRTPYDWAKTAQATESIWLMEQWECNAK